MSNDLYLNAHMHKPYTCAVHPPTCHTQPPWKAREPVMRATLSESPRSSKVPGVFEKSSKEILANISLCMNIG